VSAEFTQLCRTQAALIAPGLGAASSAIYLADRTSGEEAPNLIPVAVAPELAANLEEEWVLPEAGVDPLRPSIPPLLGTDLPLPPSDAPPHSDPPQLEDYRVVLPLMHESAIIGLLVANRDDRPWEDNERQQVERIARTLTIAYLLDRRSRWLEGRYRRIQEVETQRRNLLDDLLHQFRNPLTALGIFAKLLLQRLQPGKERDIASNIIRESDRLKDLAEQFDRALDLEADTVALPSSETRSIPLLPGGTDQVCRVEEVLSPILETARAIASEKGVELRDRVPVNLPVVAIDAKALREILNNLIDNAIKYTPTRGTVAVEAGILPGRSGAENVAVAITDTGVGIPPEDLERLFQRRYRGVQAQGNIPGTGLGLAIVRELVVQAGGDVRVDSPANHPWDTFAGENGRSGTTFVVELPQGDRRY